MALTLLFAMQTLIASGNAVNQTTTMVKFLPFVRVKVDEEVKTTRDRPDRPPAPEPQPPTHAPTNETVDTVHTTLVVPPPGVNPTARLPGRRTGLIDGGPMPVFKAQPDYPERARRRGIEGHCTVQYTISSLGTVINPSVVSCSHAVFERTSIKAAEKFRYRPRVVNGESVAVSGQRNRFVFELD
jgi:protein TonB